MCLYCGAITEYNAPKLSIEATNSLLKSNNKQIMLHSGSRYSFGKEIAEQNRYTSYLSKATNKNLMLYLLSIYIDRPDPSPLTPKARRRQTTALTYTLTEQQVPKMLNTKTLLYDKTIGHRCQEEKEIGASKNFNLDMFFYKFENIRL